MFQIHHSNFCQICKKELAKFWEEEFKRTKSVDTQKRSKDNAQQIDYNDFMEEYKETLKCTVEYGVTQESLINLWQILLKLETVRPYWQDMLANATCDDECNAYDEYRTNFIHQLSDPYKAEEVGFIWGGRFLVRLRESKHRILRMLGEIDTTLTRLRLFEDKKVSRLIVADENRQLYCNHVMLRRQGNSVHAP